MQYYYDEDFVLPGTAPEKNNFLDYSLAPDKLIITFNVYQVAPYVAGLQKAEISYKEMRDIIRPEAVFMIRDGI